VRRPGRRRLTERTEEQVRTSYRLAIRALASFALALLAATSAHSARYVGAWDPLYGAAIDGNATGDLGWRGFALFDVPGAPGCFPSDDCNVGASVLNAEVVFYDVNTNVELAKIVWPDGSLTGVSVFDIIDDGTKPVQFRTSTFPYEVPTPTSPFTTADDGPYGNFLDYEFALRFTIAFQETDFDGPVLRWRQTDCSDLEECQDGYNDFENQPARLVVTQVPEPAGLALLAAPCSRQAPPADSARAEVRAASGLSR